MKKVLLVGSINDSHIYRFVTSLYQESKEFSIDFFDISVNKAPALHAELFWKIYYIEKHFNSHLYKLPLLRNVLYLIDTKKSFEEIDKEYDIINFQYLTIHSFLFRNLLLKLQGKIVITPWGSDVYRANTLYRFCFRKIYDIADKVCAIRGSKFGDDVISLFHVPESKCVDLCFGSTVLDAVISNNTSREEAKERLFHSSDRYIITCGYNASVAQNHIKIIDAIKSVKNKQPQKALWVFPMTYLKLKGYIEQIDCLLKEIGIDYVILDKFLSDEEMIYLRKSTDVFIHMQVSDAYSSSLHEYLYSGAIVVNAEWLSYKELETDCIPYILANFDNLSEKLIESFTHKPLQMTPSLREALTCYTWSYQIKQWVEFYRVL